MRETRVPGLTKAFSSLALAIAVLSLSPACNDGSSPGCRGEGCADAAAGGTPGESGGRSAAGGGAGAGTGGAGGTGTAGNGGTADGGPDGASCPATLVACDGRCVDTQTDASNCGRCGNACEGSVCVEGACATCSTDGEIADALSKTDGTFTGATDTVTLPCGTRDKADRLFTFTPPKTATYVVGTPGSTTTVAILDGCGGAAIACEPDASRYTASASLVAGKTVTIAVEAAGATEFTLRLREAETDACCEAHDGPGCGNADIEQCVCAVAPGCCNGSWNETCGALVNSLGCGLCPIAHPFTCGDTECGVLSATARFLGVGDCCTAKNECGSFFQGECVARDNHGTKDAVCATEQVGSLRASGCCRGDGRCGVDLSALDMGCVAREDVPGASFSSKSCGDAQLPDFRTFESDQVRPLALSPDGTRLFAVNTPDDRLEIFTVGDSGISHTASVPVGLEPVAVAARTNTEVWVVNQLSDSISIVEAGADVEASPPHVTRTLWVGDEPRDIVFGGPGFKRAFVTTAHRGQNHPVDPRLLTPGIGRADVWVFDSDALGPALGGAPQTIVNLFGDTPRALAVTPDGSRVYAAIFHSGNRTTSLNEASVGLDKLPPPTTDTTGSQQPSVGLIVKYDGAHWVDELGRSWDDTVRFSLPDYDVFAIDANAATPAASTRFSGVGTTLFDMAVNPKSGALYVTNTDAHNEVRFESKVRGRFVDNRITVVANGSVTPHTLNPHIDLSSQGSAAERSLSLGLPAGIAVSSDGASLYVAATGSGNVAVLSTAALEGGTYTPDAADQIAVTGGGPTGLVLDGANQRLYVLTRFDNGISVIDVGGRAEAGHVLMPNPEPVSVTAGRPFLYDTRGTSAHGDVACGSCHPFGDMDHLAWDLGDPAGPHVGGFHPMKGPMTTQSLRGMTNDGPLHWRGDRSGAFDPGGNSLDTVAAFKQFNPAFVSLLGRPAQLSAADFQKFSDFAMSLTYPPNPIRALDDSLTPSQKAGLDLYMNRNADFIATCTGCHTRDVAAGFFGTDGRSSFDGEPQNFKIPHLRNAYQKVGRFGMQGGLGIPDTGFLGDQIRGFGYIHDGSVDTVDNFLKTSLFSLNETEEAQLASLVLAFDSTLLPVVGQQMTLDASTVQTGRERLALLVQQGKVVSPRRACDLVARGTVGGQMRGYLMGTDGRFRSDRVSEAPKTIDELLALAQDAATSLTFTCVPPGAGQRSALDRDRDGKLDRDELDHGTDPSDPISL